ncbi:hypothetical protein SPFM8_00049 [Salmonella phage SPFM8]|nr:hypothetical protein SPFM8_00049 [Salmonella phage SPFM8]
MSGVEDQTIQNAALRSRLYSWRLLGPVSKDCGPMFAAFNVDYDCGSAFFKDKPVKIVVTSELPLNGTMANNTIIAGTNNANWEALAQRLTSRRTIMNNIAFEKGVGLLLDSSQILILR